MTGETDLYGVFVPDLLIWMLVAFVLSVPLRRVLAWCGVYRLVWHRSLFSLALYVILLGIVAVLASRLFS
jgi:hypothetical protein